MKGEVTEYVNHVPAGRRGRFYDMMETIGRHVPHAEGLSSTRCPRFSLATLGSR